MKDAAAASRPVSGLAAAGYVRTRQSRGNHRRITSGRQWLSASLETDAISDNHNLHLWLMVTQIGSLTV